MQNRSTNESRVMKYNEFIAKYPGNYGVKVGKLKETRKKGKRTGKYPPITKIKTTEEVMLARGLKKFEINGQTIIALNQRNAERKYLIKNNI